MVNSSSPRIYLFGSVLPYDNDAWNSPEIIATKRVAEGTLEACEKLAPHLKLDILSYDALTRQEQVRCQVELLEAEFN